MRITASNEKKNIVSEILNTINPKNAIITPDKNDEFREKHAFFLMFIIRVNLAIMRLKIFQ